MTFSIASADSLYSIEQITPTPTSTESYTPTDLNNRGLVSIASNDFETRAFLWRDGTLTEVTDTIDADSFYVEVTGVNDRSDFVGTFLGDTSFDAFYSRRGDLIDVSAVVDETTVFAYDVNNRGVVLGESYSPAFNGAPFVWEDGIATLLPPLPGHESAFGVALNDRGVVAGYSASVWERSAVVWRDGIPTAVPVPEGTTSSSGIDVNNRGEVILEAIVNGVRQPLIYSGGTTTSLPSLPDAVTTTVADINDKGDVVGTTFVLNPETGGWLPRATLWKDGEVVDLNALIAPSEAASYLTFTGASLINDRGQIVAEARDSRSPNFAVYYLLSPKHGRK